MKIIILLNTLLMIFISSCSSSNSVRFDGIYQGETQSDSKKFIRFYKNGTVLSVASTVDAEAHDVVKWLKIEKIETGNFSKGKYEINQKKIYFSTSAEEGTVIYSGEISDNTILNLRVKSLINGSESFQTFYFVKLF
jgi:hypothetical protein